MDLTKLREPVARAIARVDGMNPDQVINYHTGTVPAWQSPMRLATADAAIESVIRALRDGGWAIVPREPSARMCDCGPLLGLGGVPPVTTSQADAVYRAMIAAGETP